MIFLFQLEKLNLPVLSLYCMALGICPDTGHFTASNYKPPDFFDISVVNSKQNTQGNAKILLQ